MQDFLSKWGEAAYTSAGLSGWLMEICVRFYFKKL